MSSGEGGIIGLQSGKVDGIVLKQREGKQIISKYFIPHNPQTARQMEIRAINTELSRSWRDDLNQGQRNAWSQRAEMIPGIRGETLYIRQNFILLDFGMERQLTPPPMVMPPELFDLTVSAITTSLQITVPHIVGGIITAQAPFIDIEIAGGFLSADYQPPVDPATNYELGIATQALSQGRVHQMSDWKHVIYVEDTEPPAAPGDLSIITINIPEPPAVRNVVAKITRYNQYGHASGERIFNKIITSA